MTCPGDIFTHAILDEMANYAHQSASTEITRHCDLLSVYICPDDRNVPERFKRTAVQKPNVSHHSMMSMSTPIFRGNKFSIGGSKK